jgi:hypothetical protein
VRFIILWHYYDAEGKLRNSSATDFDGTPRELQERISEAYKEATEAQEQKKSYSIVQQIIDVS